MPSYFYHLKFELYPTSDPTDTSSSNAEQRDVWLPPAETSVFGDLPSHRPAARPISRVVTVSANSRSRLLDKSALPSAWNSLESSADGVIDCGARAAAVHTSHRRLEVISERQWLERANSYPPPPSSAALRPQTAVNDWRFGRVNIETIDPVVASGTAEMAGESSRAGPSTVPSAAPSLGPSFGGEGTATKASFIPLETKNTEVGWGVVHFYREGNETPSLDVTEQEDEEETASSVEDCTTLCIPAVPAYMSPSDLLGFVGERWLEDISHCRMVMTSRMTRYLVLLKFRESRFAKKWKREFDGKVFNSMEVCCCVPIQDCSG